MATGTLAEKTDNDGASSEQLDAWSFYGLPKSFSKSSETARGRQIGEVRYVVGWASDQMSRMGWRVLVGGSATWNVTTPEGVPITSNGEQDDSDMSDHPVRASERLLDLVGWGASAVRQITTNLYVSGELYYIVTPNTSPRGGDWQVVSVIHPDRQKLLKKSAFSVRGLIPHPADPDSPDAPLFGVLPLLEDMDWLTRLSRSQSSNRVGMRGILGVADSLSMVNGSESFWDDLNDLIHEAMKDPTDTGMAVVRGPSELVEQSGNGMKGLSLLVPQYPYDDKIDARMAKMVERLAYGLPIPPEILLGAQAASRATAFQIEESSYRAHIEPMAERIARVAQEALSLILPDLGEINVDPDPTAILARRHSVQDALELFDRGAVSLAYLREVMGAPTGSEPDEEDWQNRARVAQVRPQSVPADPADAAASERISGAADDPITAAASTSAPMPGSTSDLAPTFRDLIRSSEPTREDVTNLDELSEALDHIDATLLAELGGATQQATERVREKLGAAVRSSDAGRSSIPSEIPNIEIATRLGEDGLRALGVSIETVFRQSVEPLDTWWDSRVRGAQKTITNILGEELAPGFTEAMVTDSTERLEEEMLSHVIGTLSSPVAQPLSAARRVGVISVAGGS